jgi:hypothetical protein
MKNRTSQIIAILMICSYFLSCNAPRNNPLDPNNPDSPFVRIEGTVQTLSLPHQNIANVKISLKESSLQVITDASGSFSIDRIYPQDGWLVFEKAGFHTDSTFVTWGDLDKITVEHYCK